MVTKISKAMTKLGEHSVHEHWQQGRGFQYKAVKHGFTKIGELRKGEEKNVFHTNRFVKRTDPTAYGLQYIVFVLLRAGLGRPDICLCDLRGCLWQISYDDLEANKEEYTIVRATTNKKTRYAVAPESCWTYSLGDSENIEAALKIGKWK